MKRRSFLGAVSAAGTVSALAGCNGEKKNAAGVNHIISATDPEGKIAGKTPEELKKEYEYWLFEDYLPFEEKYVVDSQYGGFMCNTDRDGKNLSGEKVTWFEGRGTWVHSHLFNNLKKDPKHIEIAKKSVDFMMKNYPAGKKFWPKKFTREGKPIGDPDTIFYGDIFMADGLQEFALASGEEKYRTLAKDILFKCVDIYDNSPGYGTVAPEKDKPGIENPRVLGHWMVLLNITTHMLEKNEDPDIKALNDRCLDAVMNRHLNPEYKLLNEYRNHDFSIPSSDIKEMAVGHGPETLWMVLYEAARRKDKTLFENAALTLKRHVEVFWDDVYDGLLMGFDNVEKNIWINTKALWVQVEVLIGLMLIIEHLGSDWAKEWFTRLYSYVMDKFSLQKHGFKLFIAYADRKVTFVEHYDRVENFHHPRYLMTNLETIGRIVQRGGKTSGIFA